MIISSRPCLAELESVRLPHIRDQQGWETVCFRGAAAAAVAASSGSSESMHHRAAFSPAGTEEAAAAVNEQVTTEEPPPPPPPPGAEASEGFGHLSGPVLRTVLAMDQVRSFGTEKLRRLLVRRQFCFHRLLTHTRQTTHSRY